MGSQTAHRWWAPGVVDVLLGAVMLVAPGLFLEAVHPDAMGTTFFAWQALGVAWCYRAVLAMRVARRPTAARRAALAAGYGVEVPVGLLLALAVADTGPYALPYHLARAGLGLLLALAARVPDPEFPP